MLPQALLRISCHLEGDRIVPHYFTPRDEPWLAALLAEFANFVGRKGVELQGRLREPLSVRAPKGKLRLAIHLLDTLSRDRTLPEVPPKELRAATFREAAISRAPRDAVLATVAASLGVSVAALEYALLADLHGERRVAALPKSISAARVAADANLAIVSSLIQRASHVNLAVWGNARGLVRHARRLGLLCAVSRAKPRAGSAASVAAAEGEEGVLLDVSGPFALFRHTAVYGRALASLVPRVAGCTAYELTAQCALGRGAQLATLAVRSGAPLGTGRALIRNESRIEDKFERDFRRAAPGWQLLCEPRPLASGSSLIFPDFELIHREDPSRRWLLEIVGFWTHRYLTEKLARLRAAGIERLVLCVDQKRQCAEEELPLDARLVRYKTRIDPRAVLAIVEGSK